MKLACAASLALLVASCHRPPPANPHYVLGPPYQAGGVWYYPRESYEGVETGLASVYPPNHAPLTADGEVFDQSALAAAHQTLQLPAVVRLTNLENGLQAFVRVNDRGPATPHRVIEVTHRVAALLRFPRDDGVRVRLDILPGESHAAVDAVPGAPKLDIAAAPVVVVRQVDLPPPGAIAAPAAAHPPVPRDEPEPAATPVGRLPESVTQGAPDPGRLFIQLGTFQNHRYADIQRAKAAALGATIVSTSQARQASYRVIIGPLASVEQADMVLDRVLRAGVTDARIVVE
ncbi:MAG TPA: RlpA-like double-psi beta-barrel domain-containing protein [Acetobacteraceae bacterium]